MWPISAQNISIYKRRNEAQNGAQLAVGTLASMTEQGPEPVSWNPFTSATALPPHPSTGQQSLRLAAPGQHLWSGHHHSCFDRLSCCWQVSLPERLLEATADTAFSMLALGSNPDSALTSCEAVSKFPMFCLSFFI